MLSASSTVIEELLGISKEGLTELTELYAAKRMHAKGQPHILLPQEEVLLMMMFLRHHLVDVLLGSLFSISHSVAQRVRHQMINCFYHLLQGSFLFCLFNFSHRVQTHR